MESAERGPPRGRRHAATTTKGAPNHRSSAPVISGAETIPIQGADAGAPETVTQLWQPSRPAEPSTGVTAGPSPQTKWRLLAGAASASVAAAILVIGRLRAPAEPGQDAGAQPTTTEAATSAAPVASNPPPDAEAPPPPLSVELDLPETFTVSDKMSISITSNRSAFVALLAVDASGAGLVLLPNETNAAPVSQPDSPLAFPSPAELRAGLGPIATLPPGRASSKETFIGVGVEDQEKYRTLFSTLATKNGHLTRDQVGQLLNRVQEIGGTVRDRSYEIIRLATKNGQPTRNQVGKLLNRVQEIGGTVRDRSYEVIRRKR